MSGRPNLLDRRPRFVRVDLESVPAERWGYVLRETAAIPGPVSVTLVVPACAFVPGELDELRRAHTCRVAVVSDDWVTGENWREALSRGVGPWLGMFA